MGDKDDMTRQQIEEEQERSIDEMRREVVVYIVSILILHFGFALPSWAYNLLECDRDCVRQIRVGSSMNLVRGKRAEWY
jgi:hypothetical protein